MLSRVVDDGDLIQNDDEQKYTCGMTMTVTSSSNGTWYDMATCHILATCNR